MLQLFDRAPEHGPRSANRRPAFARSGGSGKEPVSSPAPDHKTRIFYEKRVICKTASAKRPRDPGAYSTSSKILNIGRYIATMMPPTMPPTTTIINGSMIEVSALTVASTSDS